MEHNSDLFVKEEDYGRVLLLLDVEKYQKEDLECRYQIAGTTKPITNRAQAPC